MYTRKLTTKTRKGKKTMGKRVGKSINKNRNNRNNNRRTKRAGDLTKYIQAPSIGKTLAVTGSAAAQGIRNAQAGFAIVKILKKPLPSDESSRKTELINRYNQIVPILKETLIGNVKVARMGADAVFNTSASRGSLARKGLGMRRRKGGWRALRTTSVYRPPGSALIVCPACFVAWIAFPPPWR